MMILDSDTFSLLGSRHPRVAARFAGATDAVTITVITRIEALKGRFAFVLQAANGSELLRAQAWLEKTEADLARLPTIPIDNAAVAEFEHLLQNKKLKKIGRGDLLIAAITLANRATLVTRNVKDFRLVPELRIENWAD